MHFWRVISSLLAAFFAFTAYAQDLRGVWKGTLTQDAGGCYPKYFVEIQVTGKDRALTGQVFDFYDSSKFVRFQFSGKFDSTSQKFIFLENALVESHLPSDCVPCVKIYELSYHREGALEELTGSWRGHVFERQKACPPGKLTLQRSSPSPFFQDIQQADSLARIQQSLVLAPRKKELVQTVAVTVPQINIELYDNGEIDNDTVTVFVNNTLLLYRQMLTEKPLKLHINAIPGKEYELVMYADNLGLIPPNTALMVVTAGRKRMEVFMSSSEQKSASVRFVYRKPE